MYIHICMYIIVCILYMILPFKWYMIFFTIFSSGIIDIHLVLFPLCFLKMIIEICVHTNFSFVVKRLL